MKGLEKNFRILLNKVSDVVSREVNQNVIHLNYYEFLLFFMKDESYTPFLDNLLNPKDIDYILLEEKLKEKILESLRSRTSLSPNRVKTQLESEIRGAEKKLQITDDLVETHGFLVNAILSREEVIALINQCLIEKDIVSELDLSKAPKKILGRDKEVKEVKSLLLRKDHPSVILSGSKESGRKTIAYKLFLELDEEINVKIFNYNHLITQTKYSKFTEKESLREKLKNKILSFNEENTVFFINPDENTYLDMGPISEASKEGMSFVIIQDGDSINDSENPESRNPMAMFLSMMEESPRTDIKNIISINVKELPWHMILEIAMSNTEYEDFHKVKVSKDMYNSILSETKSRFNKERLKHFNVLRDTSLAVARKENSNSLKRDHISEALKALQIPKKERNAKAKKGKNGFINIEKLLKEKIFGQDSAVESVAKILNVSQAGFNDPNRPEASLLFCGPTGVGKTEIAKQLAEITGRKLEIFNMSEYDQEHKVSSLIGAPPGYVGHGDGGHLVNALKKNPDGIYLFDEIEKAHPKIFDIFLQVMEEGQVSESSAKGETLSTKDTIIIFTSNVGVSERNRGVMGIASEDSIDRDSMLMKGIKQKFKPEFLNRLTANVIFKDLPKDVVEMVVNKFLDQAKERVKSSKLKLDISREAIDYMCENYYSREYGARNIKRMIGDSQDSITSQLATELIEGRISKGDTVYIDSDGKKLKYSVKK